MLTPDDAARDPETAATGSLGRRHPGPAVRELRRENRLTLVQLGERSGVSVAFLSQIENERARPSVRTLAAIAGALGSTAASIVDAADALATVEALVRPADPGAGATSFEDRVVLAVGRVGVTEIRRSAGETELLGADRPDTLLYVVAGAIEVRTDAGIRIVETRGALRCTGGAAVSWSALRDDTVVLCVDGAGGTWD